jgi:transporter family protein
MSATTYALGAMLLWGLWGILANHSLEYFSETAVLVVTYAAALTVIVASNPDAVGDVSAGIGVAFAVGAGVTMCLGTLLYYRAVSVGKLSIVPAIPALYFVVTTIYGVTVLEESITRTQVLGIVLAAVAVGLLTR